MSYSVYFCCFWLVAGMIAYLDTLTLYLPVTKIAEFANSVDLDEVAHNEPPHQDIHCLPSSL